MRRLAAVAGVLFSALLVSWASADLEGCADAYSGGDYAEALRECRPVAERGDKAAESILGRMYDDGRGVRQNYAEAAKWYRRAADQGLGLAQFFLGLMYTAGRGGAQDRKSTRLNSSHGY